MSSHTTLNFVHLLSNQVLSFSASASLGTCMCLSTGSTVSLGELAENLPELLLWFQLYVCKYGLQFSQSGVSIQTTHSINLLKGRCSTNEETE